MNGLPRDVVNFINAVRFQCAAIPREETVACDSRFLDSIDFSGLQMKGDTEPQPSLTRSWIIGHEIGHVVLKHGSERYGFLNPIDTIQHQSKQDLPKTESAALDPPDSACKQIAEEDNQHLRRLFYVEYAADRFALDRIKPNRSMSVFDFHHSNWYMELFQKALDGHLPVPAEGSEGKRVTIHLPLDFNRHPPMFWRLYRFLTLAESTYRDFWVPGLHFMPNVTFCFDEKQSKKEEEPLGYYQNGFYIGGPEDTQSTRQLSQLVDDLVIRRAGAANGRPSMAFKFLKEMTDGINERNIIDPAFCSWRASKPVAKNIGEVLEHACFAAVLAYFIEKGVCPPDDYLQTVYSKDGPVYGQSKDRPAEQFTALATLTVLLARPCQGKGLETLWTSCRSKVRTASLICCFPTLWTSLPTFRQRT